MKKIICLIIALVVCLYSGLFCSCSEKNDAFEKDSDKYDLLTLTGNHNAVSFLSAEQTGYYLDKCGFTEKEILLAGSLTFSFSISFNVAEDGTYILSLDKSGSEKLLSPVFNDLFNLISDNLIDMEYSFDSLNKAENSNQFRNAYSEIFGYESYNAMKTDFLEIFTDIFSPDLTDEGIYFNTENSSVEFKSSEGNSLSADILNGCMIVTFNGTPYCFETENQ